MIFLVGCLSFSFVIRLVAGSCKLQVKENTNNEAKYTNCITRHQLTERSKK